MSVGIGMPSGLIETKDMMIAGGIELVLHPCHPLSHHPMSSIVVGMYTIDTTVVTLDNAPTAPTAADTRNAKGDSKYVYFSMYSIVFI
jgi:hypothetical protein